MADTDSYTSKPHPPPNPSQFYTHFLYKAAIASIFLAIIPLFPSQAPQFINQTQSWELLQLIFVGIAVSYGLFSKRNDETDVSKFDNAQSYVSRLLQVSSVFDDETENPSGFDDTKVQTWSSQYYRGEPMVVVAQESSVLDGSQIVEKEKPLFLPIRSLKTSVSESDLIQSQISRSNSKSGSKRNSNKSRNRELGGVDHLELEKNDVLSSPIPWRSRSGRMEMKQDVDEAPLYSLPPSMEESEFHLQPKNVENLVRKKSYHKSSPPPPAPPPPPPPPPPPFKSPLMKSNSSVTNNGFSSPEKKLKRSIRSVPTELGVSERTDRFVGESFDVNSKQISSELEEKMVVECDEDWETEDDEFEENPEKKKGEGGGRGGGGGGGEGGDGGPDVDKKADEFIAKFREQIRLQRIASIRKSTVQLPKKSLR